MFHHRSLLLLTLLGFAAPIFAQFTVSGTLADEAGSPLSYANAIVYFATDSSFASGTTTDPDGNFSIGLADPGQYYLRASQLGSGDYQSPAFTLNTSSPTAELGTIVLREAGGVDLAAVTVTADKPQFERRIDRTIVNIAGQPTAAGQTALEVLERSPGVVVDRVSGGISMLGKDGVRVTINGRLNYMPADALQSYLTGIPASDIIRLELITTPPADLDAEGNAGYIDIVLRRLPDEGLRGTYALTGGYGGGEVAQGNVSATYRKGRLGTFANLSYARNAIPEQSFLRRTVSGENPETTDLDFARDPVRNSINARLGADLNLGGATRLGVLLSGYTNQYGMDGRQNNRFGFSGVADTLLLTDIREDNDWLHLQTGLSLSHDFTPGKTLSVGLDYLYYDNNNPISYDLSYRPLEGSTGSRDERLNSEKASPFGITVAKVDYRQGLAGGSLSLGVKAVVANFENDVRLLRNGTRDAHFSTLNNLDETIGAAYVQYQGSTKVTDGSPALEYQLGLRYEVTDTRLDEAAGTIVDRNYGQLFPNASLGYRIGERTTVTAGYSRRINRPAFTQLAPFVIFLDPRTSFGGNAALQPGLASAIEVGVTRGGVSLNLGYTQIDSAIAAFQTVYNVATATQLIQPLNLSDQRVYSANLGFPTNLTPWWKGRINFTYAFIENSAFIGESLVTSSRGNYRVAGGQNFTLPKGWTLGLSGFYSGRNLRGYVETLPFGSLNVALRKKLPNGASLTLGVDDALNTLEIRNDISLPEQAFQTDQGFDFSQPTFKVSYFASFGNGRVKLLNRESAAEERGRID